MDSKAVCDFVISVSDADFLKGVVCLPKEFRLMALRKFMEDRGADAALKLFAEFVGLANSAITNNREFIELYAITELRHDPLNAEKLNLPDLFGALVGVGLAAKVPQENLCHGCAFRLGSPANQSPVTACDAQWCCDGGEDTFWCHENLNEKGEPTQKCRGHLLSARLAI